MIDFPNAKINIGLNILRKRPDGFHDISSCFYPVGLCDALELVAAPSDSFQASGQGIASTGDNLVTRALDLLRKDFPIPPLAIHLLKGIPIGAGLGGGSADAAFTIRLLTAMYGLDLTTAQQEEYARQLGSDCAFFIRNTPTYCYGKGDEFESIDLSLKGYSICIVNPGIHISTAEAYGGVTPSAPSADLRTILSNPVASWKHKVVNDFEDSVFARYPVIARIKESLYASGALYASMSGSGSSVYGIFENLQKIDNNFPDCFVWQGELN